MVTRAAGEVVVTGHVTPPDTTANTSVVADLQAYVDAADLWVKRTQRDLGLGSDLYVDTAHDQTGPPVPLRLSTLKGVLDRLADVCPDHGSCSRCKTPLCEACGAGEVSDSPDVLCVDCDDELRARAEDPDDEYLERFIDHDQAAS